MKTVNKQNEEPQKQIQNKNNIRKIIINIWWKVLHSIISWWNENLEETSKDYEKVIWIEKDIDNISKSQLKKLKENIKKDTESITKEETDPKITELSFKLTNSWLFKEESWITMRRLYNELFNEKWYRIDRIPLKALTEEEIELYQKEKEENKWWWFLMWFTNKDYTYIKHPKTKNLIN